MKTLTTTIVAAAALASAAHAQVQVGPVPPILGASPKVGWPAPPPRAFDEDFPVPSNPFQPDLTPGYVLIEGDIQVRLDQYLAMVNGVESTFGNVPNYWTTQIVPYDFVTSGTGAVSAANQTLAINAMNMIAARVGLTFRPANGIEDRVRFQNSSYNNSPIGRIGGAQIINIANWNVPIIVCHEVFHSLGFWHEQSRTDRGSYVTINGSNICGSGISTACTAGLGTGQCCLCADSNGTCISCAFNFNLAAGTSNLGPYDFDSFMHYGSTAFSCNGSDTITVNAPYNTQWQNNIGQRDHFSYYDAVTCRGLYPFANDRWMDATWFGSQGGTMLTPWNLTFATAVAIMPVGGALYFQASANYPAVGTYNTPMTIDAPGGPITLGN